MKKASIFFIGLILSVLVLYWTMPSITNAFLINEEKKYQKIQFPFFGNLEDNKFYELRGDVNRNLFWQRKINLYIKGCLLEVNINNQKIVENEKCVQQINILSLDNLNLGSNDIGLKFKSLEENLGTVYLFTGGFWGDGLFLFLSVISIIFTLLIFISFLKSWVIKDNLLVFILTIGLVIRIFYCLNTPFFERDHDNSIYSGHLGYIQYIVFNFSLPSVKDGWEFYQPPLYYFFEAIIFKISEIFRVYNTFKIQQFFNITISMGFIISSFLIFKEFLVKKKDIVLAMILLVFLPSGIMHSARIGNDFLYYLFFNLSLLFFIKWFKKVLEGKFDNVLNTDNFYFLLFSFFCADLTVLTKSNGVLLYIIFIMSIFLFFLKKIKVLILILKKNLRKLLILLFVGFLPFCLLFFRQIDFSGKVTNLLVANAVFLPSSLAVGNKIENFFNFDFRYFFEPFAKPFLDEGGRQFFLVYLFKTAVIGEWVLNGQNVKNIVIGLFFSFFGLVLIGIIYLFLLLMKKEKLKQYFVLVVTFVVLLSALVCFRIAAPYSSSQDFRYIFPISIPLFIFTVKGIDFFKRKKFFLLEYGSYLVLLFFIILSIWLFGVIQ